MNDDKRKTILKKTFDAIGEDYDTPALSFFVESVKDIATYVNYRGDEKVIDIATGTGHVAFALAELACIAQRISSKRKFFTFS